MRILIALFLAVVSLSSADGDDTVRLEEGDGKLDISIGKEKFATYRFAGFNKPFLEDVSAPGGVVVTRSLAKEAVTDHPHHKGLWLSVDEVNHNKHWMEAQPIKTERVEVVKAEGNPAVFRVENVWFDNQEQPLLKETTTVQVFADRLLTYDVTLASAGNEPVTIGDTKEGFFAIRVRDELREKGGSGKITNANGATGEPEAWGQASPWVDYSGTVDGQPVGVAIFDHPSNFRPSRYHVRSYGLFAVSPFGESAYTNGKSDAQPLTLKSGDSLRLRYAALFHAGDAESADVAGRYKEYSNSVND